MSDTDKVKGRPIGNLLYTKESDDSREKTKAELELEDPKSEKALGILTGQSPQDQSKSE